MVKMISKKEKVRVRTVAIRALKILESILKQTGHFGTPEGRHLLKVATPSAQRAQAKLDRPPKSDLQNERDDLEEKVMARLSRYVRLRDTIPAADGRRVGRCCTCEKPFYYEQLQCGHWIPRANQGTRYHPRNCNAQCGFCNSKTGRNGWPERHRQYIARRYGEAWIKRLEDLRDMEKRVKTVPELRKILEKLNIEIEKIERRDGIGG